MDIWVLEIKFQIIFLFIFQKLNLIKGKVISINIGIPGKYFK